MKQRFINIYYHILSLKMSDKSIQKDIKKLREKLKEQYVSLGNDLYNVVKKIDDFLETLEEKE